MVGTLAVAPAFRQNTLGRHLTFMSTHSVPMNPLFTIGHSNLEIELLLSVLARHRVGELCDVRSRPASFRFPQFNREPLESALISAGVRYEFFGESLGGRPPDPRVYREDGLVDYAARRRAPDFAAGIERALVAVPSLPDDLPGALGTGSQSRPHPAGRRARIPK